MRILLIIGLILTTILISHIIYSFAHKPIEREISINIKPVIEVTKIQIIILKHRFEEQAVLMIFKLRNLEGLQKIRIWNKEKRAINFKEEGIK